MCAYAPSAQAIDFAPQLNGVVSFEIQNDWTFDADDSDAEINALYGTIEPYFILSFNDRIALEASLVFETVRDADPGENWEFGNEGLYAEELKLSYTGNNFTVYGGKFNPAFGSAWDMAPGLYGDELIDYELKERLGFGGNYTLDTENAGYHTLTATTFFLDTSFLSESEVTHRGRADKSDGGMSNTEDLSSYSITLDSEWVGHVDGLNTHIGYYKQKAGDADTGLDDEHAFAIGANYTFDLTDDIETMVIGEWATIRNFEGDNVDATYYTAGIGFGLYENWNLGMSYTRRDKDVQGGPDVDDDMFQISGGYAFENGITFDVGYMYKEDDNDESNTLGALVGYSFEF